MKDGKGSTIRGDEGYRQADGVQREEPHRRANIPGAKDVGCGGGQVGRHIGRPNSHGRWGHSCAEHTGKFKGFNWIQVMM